MKKTQKKLGNKGFSLVELIVVIAIMAVLVGVLAPTLIRNVENSRVSKDAQNIDSIKNAIEVTLQKEEAYQEAIAVGDVITFDANNKAVIKSSGLTEFTKEFNNTLDLSKSELTSKKYKDAKDNVGNFYVAPEGDYHRTGALRESPTMSVSGMHGELSLNTGYAYSPAGRDTNTIYNYAESGSLLGNGGFWAKTEADVQKNIKSEAKRS